MLEQRLVFSWSRPILRGSLLQQLNVFSSSLNNVTITDEEDTWIWSLGSPTFSVKGTREHIDNNLFLDEGNGTIWNRFLPKKINIIFIWRALRDRLPSRWNISRKGIELETLSCPICDSTVETTIHTLWSCSLAEAIWQKVFAWLDLDVPHQYHIRDLFTWIGNMQVNSSKKLIIEAICGVSLWSLWKFRNDFIFGAAPPKRSFLFDSIVENSFRWYSSRNKMSTISWNNWMQNPLMYSPL